MPLINNPESVRALYKQAVDAGVCLPNFCTGSTYTTEAAFKAVYEFGQKHDNPNLPLILSATANHPDESQLLDYTHLNEAKLGLRAFINDVELFLSEDSPYRDLQVMLHFDHGQPDTDERMFELAAEKYATIMFDASKWDMATNIKMTRDFVQRMKEYVLVEGAVTEIAKAKDHADVPLTTVDDAKRFLDETGVFLIVPDLGTEHLATSAVAKYDGALAREMTNQLGHCLVLHGSSSLQTHHLKQLAGDGIVKVNIWTMFEKTGGQAVARYILENLDGILSPDELQTLHHNGSIGDQFFTNARQHHGPDVDVFRQSMYRDVWQEAVVQQMTFYLESFNYAQFPKITTSTS